MLADSNLTSRFNDNLIEMAGAQAMPSTSNMLIRNERHVTPVVLFGKDITHNDFSHARRFFYWITIRKASVRFFGYVIDRFGE